MKELPLVFFFLTYGVLRPIEFFTQLILRHTDVQHEAWEFKLKPVLINKVI